MIRRSRDHADRGVALPVVMVLGLVMAMLVGTSLTAVSSGLTVSDRAQDTTGALDAAFAGVQEYAARLNTDSTFQSYGNSQSTFTTASGSTVTTPATTNPALGVGSTGTWATVPGSSGTATYRYEVDNSKYATTGVVNLRSTGRVGAVTRSVVAQLRQSGFTNYLYFTDYEAPDPIITGNQACAVHIWDPTHVASCQITQFGSNDVLRGPVHSNDVLTICGTTFGDAVTSSNPNIPISSTPDDCGSTATYAVGGGVTFAPTLAMPPSNSTMQPFAASTGCLYTGPTQVTYNGNGTMTVKSPWTKQTEPTGSSGTTPPKCGTLADLRSNSGATVPVLSSSLLFVQDVPIQSTDPNYSSTAKADWPANFTCLDSSGNTAASSSASSGGWKSFGVQYPRSNEAPPSGWGTGSSWNTTSPAYGCRSGDLFVSGVVQVAASGQGATTAAASNYVYVTDDLTYKSRTNDLLGLVGNSAVLVWNPTSASVVNGKTVYQTILTDRDREIDAALLSVQHTFQVQNRDRGSERGTLAVFGSIAQKFRGGVAQVVTVNGVSSTTGYYTKDYQYDSRLVGAVPPYFLAPASASFSLSRIAQVPAAFTTTGATP